MDCSRTQELPVLLVVFGASGDLTHRKLIPALYNLHVKGQLPSNIRIVGVARRPYDDASFRQGLLEGVESFSPATFEATVWDAFADRISYVHLDLHDESSYTMLHETLDRAAGGAAHRLYYLATGPELFGPIIHALGAHGLAGGDGPWRRIVVEKPFGRDLASAQALDQQLHAVFAEDEIFRIDHYLGKETAQNILFFRFGNTIFEPIWNRQYIDHVQITVAESVTVGRRAGYYDGAGVLRDMFQNHLLQLLSLVAMEPPASFNAETVRNEKAELLAAIRPIDVDDTVCAQYEGYLDEPGVAPDSRTPTYAALKLFIDNWRWKGVPFYLRSGKAMATKTSEIIVVFQQPPHVMFQLPPGESITQNALAIRIQPSEGIHLRFEIKVPDAPQDTHSVFMDFNYETFFGKDALPEAYERLLLDAISGDASLYTRRDALETSWRLIDPLVGAWTIPGRRRLLNYAQKSWGPTAAAELLIRDGRAWRIGCSEIGAC